MLGLGLVSIRTLTLTLKQHSLIRRLIRIPAPTPGSTVTRDYQRVASCSSLKTHFYKLTKYSVLIPGRPTGNHSTVPVKFPGKITVFVWGKNTILKVLEKY